MLKVHRVTQTITSFIGTDVASNEPGNKERIHCFDAVERAAAMPVVITICCSAEATQVTLV